MTALIIRPSRAEGPEIQGRSTAPLDMKASAMLRLLTSALRACSIELDCHVLVSTDNVVGANNVGNGRHL
jgi:hypothetical protein